MTIRSFLQFFCDSKSGDLLAQPADSTIIHPNLVEKAGTSLLPLHDESGTLFAR
jgi:hypothetical protein